MFSPDDTIVALATPPGRGGLAVVRLSGPRAREIASSLIADDVRLEARRATLVHVVARGGVSAGEASAGSGTQGSAPLGGVATSGRPRVIVGTKSDLPHAWELAELAELACGSESAAPEVVAVSATTGGGIDVLIRSINRNIGICDTQEPALVSNVRHVELLGRSAEASARAEMLAE